VDGRERDAAGVVGPLEQLAQPRLEPADLGVEVGHLDERLEVVAVRLAVAARRVEQLDRAAEAHPVEHVLEHVAGRPVAGAAGHLAQVVGQLGQLVGHLDVVDA
jgi:hypothetical protein